MTTNNLQEMFSTERNSSKSNGGNQLQATAQLTSMSTSITNAIMKAASADLEKYSDMLRSSQKSHDAMDKLISELYNLSEVNVDFLQAESEEALDKMIRSQQSKRSRAKSKAMTLDNYESMMIGAVAENLLRLAANKPKSAGGGTYNVTDSTYTDEQLQELAADKEKLGKAIRNVQSKKSIFKSKAEFDESSERWTQLLEEEALLKALREGSSETVVKAVETNQKVQEMLATIDPDTLKAADAKSILAQIQQMLNA